MRRWCVTEPDLRALHPPIAGPLPDVTTDRLDLRRFRPGDEAVLAPVFAKPEVWRFPYGRGFTRRGDGCVRRHAGRPLGRLRVRLLARP